ncbi:MAG: pilus assembly protein PilM [Bdellovibrionales bacterium]|nr:pilus assembly protein PilM [Bdellovibrionales bacterium]
MKIIGIDIGSYKIKIVEIHPNSSGGEVTHYEEHKLSQDPNKDRQIEILDFLRNYEETQDLDGVHYIVGANPFQVAHRKLSFPFKERHSILKSLAIELEDNIPFSIDNAVFDAKVLKYTQEGAEVFASACPLSVVESILEELQNCKIEPHILSSQTLALTNLLEDWQALPPDVKNIPTTPKPMEVILNIGHKYTSALVYRDKILTDVRSFHWGGEKLIQAITLKYKITLPEAYTNLQKNSFLLIQNEEATEEQISYSDLLKNEIDKFAHELLLIFLELKSQHQVEIGKIYTTGKVSSIKNFNPYLTQKLEVATGPLSFNPKSIQLSTDHFDAQSGAVALGLAIEGLKKPRNPATNFLKGEYARQNSQFKYFKEKWGKSLAYLMLVIVTLTIGGIIRDNLSTQMIDEAQDTLKNQAKSVANIKGARGFQSKIKKYINDQKKLEKLNELQANVDKVNSAMDILGQLANITPTGKSSGINIKLFDLVDETLTIEGIANKSFSLTNFENSLKSLSINKKVIKKSTQIAPTTTHKPFAFQLKVKRTEGGL